MGGPLTVIFSDTYMMKLENDIVVPLKSNFYRRYVDDMFNRRKVDASGILFEKVNNYHPKIKFTIELNSKKFLDTKLVSISGFYSTLVN